MGAIFSSTHLSLAVSNATQTLRNSAAFVSSGTLHFVGNAWLEEQALMVEPHESDLGCVEREFLLCRFQGTFRTVDKHKFDPLLAV